MDKTASEYGMRLVHTIQETSEELIQAQTSPKFLDTEKFHEESVRALNKIIVSIRKYLPKLHKGLKTEMAALNTALEARTLRQVTWRRHWMNHLEPRLNPSEEKQKSSHEGKMTF